MSRVSYQQFSSGLPVQRETLPTQSFKDNEADQSSFLSGLNPFGKANRDRLKDIPSDLAETFDGAVDQVSGAFTNNDEIRKRVESGETTPLQGTAETIGGGLRAGAGVVGEALIGAGKLFTTPEQEEKVKNLVTTATEAVAGTRPVQEIKAQYDEMTPQEQRNVQSFLGAAEGFGTMFGAKPVFDVLRQTLGAVGSAGDAAVDATKNAASNLKRNRTSQEAADDIVAAANPVEEATDVAVKPSNAVLDTVKGAGTQIRDFARRTANEAQDTAKESRRLAEMPAPKATLIKNGADEKIVNVIDRSTPEEIPLYRELVNQAKIAEQFPEDPKKLPKVIAGREFMKPVGYVIDQRKAIGKELGEARKGLSTTKNIDTNPAFRSFHTYLKENYQVRFDKEGKIVANTGTIASGDVPQIQKLYDQLRSDKLNSEAELDQWLQRTLKDFDLVQKREKTFSEEVSKIAEVARGQVGELMPPNYNQLRTQYAQISQPLNEMVKLLGYKGNLDEFTAKELKAGEVALRMLGNAADRPQSAIDGILDAAAANGYKSTVDINKLLYITDQLEDLYDITPTRGFSGSNTRGINQSSAGVAADAATFNIGGLFDRAMNSRASQKEIQASFEEYIKFLDEGEVEPGTFTPAQKTKSEQANVEEVVGQLIEKAPEAKTYIDDMADGVAVDIPNVRVAKAPIKSVDRAIEKVNFEEAGDATKLRDLARNSLVAMDGNSLTASLSRMDEILEEVKAEGLYARKKVQEPEQFSGYGGVIYNIETPNGLVAEIQVVEPGMIFGKMLPEDAKNILGEDLFKKIEADTGVTPGYGHEIYEKLRALSVADLEGPKGQALIKESVDYYEKLR